MSPRPILKQHSVSTEPTHHHHHQQQYVHHSQIHYAHHNHHSHGVHFPPSPSLTRTFSAYSSAAYDRSPIVVSPNTCALPERGCPGRTYLLDEQASSSPRNRGIAYARDYHPRALAFASYNNGNANTNVNANANSNYAPVPPLVPDLSSESDESDGFYNITGESEQVPSQSYGIHGLAGPSGGSGSSSGSATPKFNSYGYTNGYTNPNSSYGYTNDAYPSTYAACDSEESDTLHFLPHGRPSSPPVYGLPSEGDRDILPSSPVSSSSLRSRRKRGGERRHESSMDPDRIPGGGGSGAGVSASPVDPSSLGFGSLSISSSPGGSASGRKRATSPSSTRKKGVRRTVQPPSGMMMQLQQHQQQQGPPAFGGFGVPDDGCLGGF